MTSEQLSALLHEHVRKGDPVDVANLAMMLHQNGQVIEPPAAVVTDEMVEILRAEVERLRDELRDRMGSAMRVHDLAAKLVDELDSLVVESDGVSGLHLNGDVATWDELLPGGRFERLSSLDELRAALAQQPAGVDGAIDKARFEQAPCYLCGYNGPGYYQPDTHPCAAKYHAAQQPAARPPKPTECMNGCPDRQVCDHCQWPPGPDQRPSPPTASKEMSND